MKIYYNNINGMASKKESLNLAVGSSTPDIIALCETKLGSKSEPKIPSYEAVYHNFKRGKEGLLVAAREGTFLDIEKMTKDEEDGDKNILAVQIVYPNFTLRVIVGHAPQETDKSEVRERFFESLKLEVERGQLNGDRIMVVGDMNGRIQKEEDSDVINSPNGHSLTNLSDECGLHVSNFHPNTIGK